MCNLYSYTRAQAEAIAFARALRDKAGNLPPLPAIFPDQMAPIVRTGEDGKRELVMMRWGFPSPPIFGNPRPVTNVRNVKSAYWKRWLQPEQRCLVPATSFCEYHDKPDPKTKRKTPHWFALSEKRPIVTNKPSPKRQCPTEGCHGYLVPWLFKLSSLQVFLFCGYLRTSRGNIGNRTF